MRLQAGDAVTINRDINKEWKKGDKALIGVVFGDAHYPTFFIVHAESGATMNNIAGSFFEEFNEAQAPPAPSRLKWWHVLALCAADISA